jgi:hypothetical protein
VTDSTHGVLLVGPVIDVSLCRRRVTLNEIFMSMYGVRVCEMSGE